MGHYLATDLRDQDQNTWGLESRAILSDDAGVRACIVFIHGFGGHAVETWLDFPALLPSESVCARCDALFFGYDGLYDTADFSAASLRDFLSALLDAPAPEILNPSRPAGATSRAETFRYDRIILCAHSLGAVVTRRAILDLVQQFGRDVDSMQRICLQFFAPAHKGAHVIEFGAQVLAAIPLPFPVDGLAAAAIRMKFPVLQDLEVGCQTLANLEVATQTLLQSNPARYAFLRAHVVHGQKDRVVAHAPFGQDHPQQFVRGHGHQSVCKPSGVFRAPLASLLMQMGGL